MNFKFPNGWSKKNGYQMCLTLQKLREKGGRYSDLESTIDEVREMTKGMKEEDILVLLSEAIESSSWLNPNHIKVYIEKSFNFKEEDRELLAHYYNAYAPNEELARRVRLYELNKNIPVFEKSSSDDELAWKRAVANEIEYRLHLKEVDEKIKERKALEAEEIMQ